MDYRSYGWLSWTRLGTGSIARLMSVSKPCRQQFANASWSLVQATNIQDHTHCCLQPRRQISIWLAWRLSQWKVSIFILLGFSVKCSEFSVLSFEAYTLSRLSRCRCEITSDSCATVQFWRWALQPTLMTSAFLDALLQLLLHRWEMLQKTLTLATVVSFAPHVDDQCIPRCIAAVAVAVALMMS